MLKGKGQHMNQACHKTELSSGPAAALIPYCTEISLQIWVVLIIVPEVGSYQEQTDDTAQDMLPAKKFSEVSGIK